MQTWWNSSPYYDTSVYLPGSPNRKTDSALTQAWIQGAEQQGWGLIPIWFGLQSSCVITKAGISQFFGPTVAAASTQGAQQADLAIAAAATLGLTTGVIYTDIENYTVNGTCSPLVQAYVDGWDSELHLNGYLAGVYANPGPITSDISQVSTIPDEIWVTKTSANTKPQATIWNQGISDALWPKDQRIHQFLIDQPSVSFGGYTLPQGIKIDDDVDDAPVISATGTKPVGLAYTTVDCPGATNTYPVGINSINNNNGAYINGSGQVGTIVGQYYDSNNAPHAYESSGSTCVNIDYPGALVTWPMGSIMWDRSLAITRTPSENFMAS